jgi:hypothetical protein
VSVTIFGVLLMIGVALAMAPLIAATIFDGLGRDWLGRKYKCGWTGAHIEKRLKERK